MRSDFNHTTIENEMADPNDIDVYTEAELLRRAHGPGVRPQVLNSANITVQHARFRNVDQYRVEDLVKTVIYLHDGIDAVSRVFDHQLAGTEYFSNVTGSLERGHRFKGWYASIGNEGASISIYPALPNAQVDMTLYEQRFALNFRKNDIGAWIVSSCKMMWDSEWQSRVSSISFADYAVKKFLLHEIATWTPLIQIPQPLALIRR